jgi:hypothetical protein
MPRVAPVSRTNVTCADFTHTDTSHRSTFTRRASDRSATSRNPAGQTQERQQPVGDSGRHEPRQIDAILDAELRRALDDPDPLRGIAQLTARIDAALELDPHGVTRTKALGSERLARKLRDALPGGANPLRAAVWEFLRPMLSPTLVALNRDVFVLDAEHETTVELQAHRGESDLADLDLGDDEHLDTAA